MRVIVLLCQLIVCAGSVSAAYAATRYPAGELPAAKPGVTPVAIFGSDDRRDLPDTMSPLEGRIGMLYEQSTQTLCTAFCVEKDVIATAAHCLFQAKNGRLPDLGEVTFRLSYGGTQLNAGIFGRRTPFTKHYIAVGTTAFNNEPPLSAPRDWALVKLERAICRFGTIPIVTQPVPELIKKSDENKIFQVAYHWDYKHWQLAYSTPCRIQRDYDQIRWRFIRQHFIDHEQLLLHTCDTGGASSGSPILLDSGEPSAPVAVAINVGTYTRTRILLKKGEVVKRLSPDIIANTGVNGTAFHHVIPELASSEMIASHEDMVRLQSELTIRGLYSGTLDGELGRATRAAIVAFESSVGALPTGLPTVALLRRFGEDRLKSAHTYSNGRGIVSSGPGPVPGPAPEATPPATTIAPPTPPRRSDAPPRRTFFNPFGTR